MKELIALSALRPGEAGLLRRLDCRGPTRRRLRALGFIEGATLRCLGRSPGGGSAAYAVFGSVFALRDRDCAALLAERAEGGGT